MPGCSGSKAAGPVTCCAASLSKLFHDHKSQFDYYVSSTKRFYGSPGTSSLASVTGSATVNVLQVRLYMLPDALSMVLPT